jgi:hypothetical protein
MILEDQKREANIIRKVMDKRRRIGKFYERVTPIYKECGWRIKN